jgi:hypothetical protein
LSENRSKFSKFAKEEAQSTIRLPRKALTTSYSEKKVTRDANYLKSKQRNVQLQPPESLFQTQTIINATSIFKSPNKRNSKLKPTKSNDFTPISLRYKPALCKTSMSFYKINKRKTATASATRNMRKFEIILKKINQDKEKSLCAVKHYLHRHKYISNELSTLKDSIEEGDTFYSPGEKRSELRDYRRLKGAFVYGKNGRGQYINPLAPHILL